MSNLLLEKKSKVFAGKNLIFKFTASILSGGKIRFYSDHIEFDLLTVKRELNNNDVDAVEIRGNYFRFRHHGDTSKYLAIMCLPKDREDIINTIRSLKLKIIE